MTPDSDESIEHATRAFLLRMAREAARRHPQRIENPVPDFDALPRRDQLMLMGVIKATIRAAISYAQASRVPA